MSEAQRDDTQDWILPAAARPVTMLELEERVDVALAAAKSAEATAVEIGAAAFDAADQARRAAEMAERAVGLSPGSVVDASNGGTELESDAARELEGEATRDFAADDDAAAEADDEAVADEAAEEWLRRFSARADRVMVRLRALEPVS